MARNVVPLRDAANGDDSGGAGKTSIKAIGEKAFAALVKKCKSLMSSMSTDKSTLGGYISDACERQNLHKGAYGIYRRLDAMDPYKRSELLFHFDLYREWAKWDETDMFDRSGEEAAE